jgi:hypothetical protein
VTGLRVDRELRRGAESVRVVIVATTEAFDVAGALSLTWEAVLTTACDDAAGWDLPAAEAEVWPAGKLTPVSLWNAGRMHWGNIGSAAAGLAALIAAVFAVSYAIVKRQCPAWLQAVRDRENAQADAAREQAGRPGNVYGHPRHLGRGDGPGPR